MYEKWKKLEKEIKLFIDLHGYTINIFKELEQSQITKFAYTYYEKEMQLIRDMIFSNEAILEKINNLIVETANHYKIDLLNTWDKRLFIVSREDTLTNLENKKKLLNDGDKSKFLMEYIGRINKDIKTILSHHGLYPYYRGHDSNYLNLEISGFLEAKNINKDSPLKDLDIIDKCDNGQSCRIVNNKKNINLLNDLFQELFDVEIRNFKVLKISKDLMINKLKLRIPFKNLNALIGKLKNESIEEKEPELLRNFTKLDVKKSASNLSMGLDVFLNTIKGFNNGDKTIYDIGKDLESLHMFFVNIANFYKFSSPTIEKYNNKSLNSRKREIKIIALRKEIANSLDVTEIPTLINQAERKIVKWIICEGFHGISNFNISENGVTFTVDFRFNKDFNLNAMSLKVEQPKFDEMKNRFDFICSHGNQYLKLSDNNINKLKILFKDRFPKMTIRDIEIRNMHGGKGLYINSIEIFLQDLKNI